MESDTLLIISTQICLVAILMKQPILIAISVIGFILYVVKATVEMSIEKKSIEHLKNIKDKWSIKK